MNRQEITMKDGTLYTNAQVANSEELWDEFVSHGFLKYDHMSLEDRLNFLESRFPEYN